jgi:Ca2+/H+ antiporter
MICTICVYSIFYISSCMVISDARVSRSLSFVTEQVAEHTNGTIGALLNATFGNAPELLIATAALRSGFYRVVQLAMLGSMLTNLLFVFGISCMIGGCRWQVQELRLVSGNVSVGLLLLAVAGSLLPAGLILSGQLEIKDPVEDGMPSKEELQLSRVNAIVMVTMYGCYLVFQLGTHKEEFDEDFDNENNTQMPGKSRRNVFCLSLWSRFTGSEYYSPAPVSPSSGGDVELPRRDRLPLLKEHGSDQGPRVASNGEGDHSSMSDSSGSEEGGSNTLLPQNEGLQNSYANGYFDEYDQQHEGDSFSARRRKSPKEGDFSPGSMLPLGLADPSDGPPPPAGKPFPVLGTGAMSSPRVV